MRRGKRSQTLVILLALVFCTAGLAACGDDGPEPTSTSAEAQAESQAKANAEIEARNEEARKEYEQRRRAEAPSEDEQEAEQTATDFYAILGADRAKDNPNKTVIDSGSFCDLMSEGARAQTVHYAEVSSGIEREWDCESAVNLLVLRSKRTGGFNGVEKAEVIGVNAEGDKATATVRFGGGPATSLPLVREDGEWKLGETPPVAADTGG